MLPTKNEEQSYLSMVMVANKNAENATNIFGKTKNSLNKRQSVGGLCFQIFLIKKQVNL